MNTKRSKEGYFMMDHRAGGALPDDIAVAHGLPAGAGRGLFEAPTYTCSHCEAVVVLNPNRTRERAYCRGCDRYICDACGVERAKTLQCRPFQQIIDQTLTAAEKQLIIP